MLELKGKTSGNPVDWAVEVPEVEYAYVLELRSSGVAIDGEDDYLLDVRMAILKKNPVMSVPTFYFKLLFFPSGG